MSSLKIRLNYFSVLKWNDSTIPRSAIDEKTKRLCVLVLASPRPSITQSVPRLFATNPSQWAGPILKSSKSVSYLALALPSTNTLSAVRHVYHVPDWYHVVLRHEPRQSILGAGFLAQARTDVQDPVRERGDPFRAGEVAAAETVPEREEIGEGGPDGAEEERGGGQLRGDSVLNDGTRNPGDGQVQIRAALPFSGTT